MKIGFPRPKCESLVLLGREGGTGLKLAYIEGLNPPFWECFTEVTTGGSKQMREDFRYLRGLA